ncbi:MAG: hypothetical protein WBE41_26320, partial [Terracidiphilus sp.]
VKRASTPEPCGVPENTIRTDSRLAHRSKVSDIRIKLPELQPQKVTTFGQLANDAVAYAKAHLRTWVDYDWKERALREEFGSRSAVEITP